MLLRIGYDIVFDAPAPAAMMLMLYTHPSRSATLLQPDILRIEPEIPIEEFTDWFGNHCARIYAPAGKIRLWNDTLVEDTGLTDEVNWNARQHAVQDLPVETLQYLLGSRYCELEPLINTAWELFGNTPLGWARVQAVCDWVHSHVKFDYMSARPTKTAFDVYNEKVGVCRDFQHLAITLLRCLNIPARYATGYLGDIGVPVVLPMDFSAWFEAYLDGRWYTFDARNNVPRIGRVLMATGRDAVDVALTTTFGFNTLDKFVVWTDEIADAANFVAAPQPAPG